MLTEKQTPPISSKQQESYSMESKQKTSVFALESRKQTEYENNAWENEQCQNMVCYFTISGMHKARGSRNRAGERTVGDAGSPGIQE